MGAVGGAAPGAADEGASWAGGGTGV